MRTDSGAAVIRPRWFLLLPLQWALLVGLGALVTAPWAARRPLSAENGVNRALAAHRTEVGNTASQALSTIAGTQGVIAVTLVCVVALLVLPRRPRWGDALFLAGAVAAQSAVFVLVTLCVNRSRPDVAHLEQAPPTSSFPSGHVGAALALYGGLALLAAALLRGPWRLPAVVAPLLVPAAVAVSRLYAGMHHPTDVLGGLLNGACTLFVMTRAVPSAGRFTFGPPGPRLPADAAAAAAATGPGGRRAVVVRHPHACPDELAARVRAVLNRHGYTEQQWTSTTVERPSGELAALAAVPGTALVVVCGGDGTVRACAGPLVGTGTAMAVVPCGTGNLLARNLHLPTDAAAALEQALAGEPAGIDVGRVHGDGLPATCFTVMAGAGLDAAMVRDASDRLKAHLGWSAYVLSGIGHLTDPRMRLTIQLDGGPVLRRRARMVLIGNVGALQGGLPLLPRAQPDSGFLDLVLLNPRGPAGWAAAAGYLGARMLPRRRAEARGTGTTTGPLVAHGALEYHRARRIDIAFATPQARELDGDVVADGTRLTVQVQPAALRIHLPASGPAPTPADARTPADRALTSGS
ncbi:diacylglycerol kinase family protein [Streptomyces sp. NPDC002574]|uniref:diacylglycerol kinase family protein n=1 Tax=Streptomyces sp. NPDC002574 TaxID=3364652 RepID=UPI00368630F7